MKIMCKLSDESKGGAEMCPSFELDATEALKFSVMWDISILLTHEGNFFLTEPENPLELDKIFHFPIEGGKPWGEWLLRSCL